MVSTRKRVTRQFSGTPRRGQSMLTGGAVGSAIR
jgi:hypothetical protein